MSTPEGVTELFESDDDDAIQWAEDELEELGFPECGYKEESESFEGTELTPEQRAAATMLDVTATEYSFEGVPASVAAGPLALTLTNGGGVEHEIGIVKIKDGVSPEDAIAKAKVSGETHASLGMIGTFTAA